MDENGEADRPHREMVYLVALGKATFERYAEAMEGVTHDGRGIPPWPELGNNVRAAWIAAALTAAQIGLPGGAGAIPAVDPLDLDPEAWGLR